MARNLQLEKKCLFLRILVDRVGQVHLRRCAHSVRHSPELSSYCRKLYINCFSIKMVARKQASAIFVLPFSEIFFLISGLNKERLVEVDVATH